MTTYVYESYGRPTREWPSREEWAKRHRTWYGDTDELCVSDRLTDYATPEEIAAAIAEAKALWTELGRQMKAAGPVISDAEWRRRYLCAPDRPAMDELLDTPEYRRILLRDRRSRLNRGIIKPMVAGQVPKEGLRWGKVRSGEDFTDQLPKAAELANRRHDAWEAAFEAKKAEYAARPVDDAAWEAELRRRASVERWLDGDRFGARRS